MKILFVSAEAAPFIKVGGLADVAAGLPKSLNQRGHEARVILPAYQMILDDPRWSLEVVIPRFKVQMNPIFAKEATLYCQSFEGVEYYFIGTDDWFNHTSTIGEVYQNGGESYAFFAAAVLRAMELLDWIPDVFHCNDWHTGFIPLLLREKSSSRYRNSASIMTIHNIAYQGEFGIEALDWLNLPHSLYNYHQVEAWGRVNLLKSGIAFSDAVNTVSPTYAEQIRTPHFGHGLDGLLQFLSDNGKLSGILNGIDTDIWNPATDPALPVHFDAESLKGKAECRKALFHHLKLEPASEGFLVGMVSRLSHQKGFDLVLAAAPLLFEYGIQLVVQGLGDAHVVHGFHQLETRYPNHFRFVNEFAPETAQLIYAGSDAFLMPSEFEPCGLGQMIAMRYGTVPIVRSTGGLKDTVQDSINGFSFGPRSSIDLVETVRRAQQTHQDPTQWQKLVLAGMQSDWSWQESAGAYENLYRNAVKSRSGFLMH